MQVLIKFSSLYLCTFYSPFEHRGEETFCHNFSKFIPLFFYIFPPPFFFLVTKKYQFFVALIFTQLNTTVFTTFFLHKPLCKKPTPFLYMEKYFFVPPKMDAKKFIKINTAMKKKLPSPLPLNCTVGGCFLSLGVG